MTETAEDTRLTPDARVTRIPYSAVTFGVCLATALGLEVWVLTGCPGGALALTALVLPTALIFPVFPRRFREFATGIVFGWITVPLSMCLAPAMILVRTFGWMSRHSDDRRPRPRTDDSFWRLATTAVPVGWFAAFWLMTFTTSAITGWIVRQPHPLPPELGALTGVLGVLAIAGLLLVDAARVPARSRVLRTWALALVAGLLLTPIPWYLKENFYGHWTGRLGEDRARSELRDFDIDVPAAYHLVVLTRDTADFGFDSVFDGRFTGPATAFDEHDRVMAGSFLQHPRRPHPVACDEMKWRPAGLDCSARELLLDNSAPPQRILLTRSDHSSDLYVHLETHTDY
ncbi:hypothetical protein ACFXHA_11615 [Nocardia sp. NPDC059240]|uniref:hypothetical protein n=1 Tax=Nocardia sp. NPDC059240 TaxID=3346786 RepID=UPI0036BB0E17